MKRYYQKHKKTWIALSILIISFGILQFTTKPITHPPSTAPFEGPPEVMKILRRSCYDCHSNETKLVWYDRIAPASWLVNKDVEKGRKALNFSEWGKLSAKQKTGTLYNIVNFIMLEAMPLPNYIKLHSNAKVSASDLTVLKNYTLSETPRLKRISDTIDLRTASGMQTVNKQLDGAYADLSLGNRQSGSREVAPAPNGIKYPRGYGDWELISMTDRFDNHSIRVIFGNDIAVKAIRQNNIQPWPDGAVLAKVLWKRALDSKGLIIAGEFIHAEFMMKDAVRYATTNGWGWARWVGKELQPYGKTPAFTSECTNCHQPVKDFDYVFTMPLNIKQTTNENN